MTDTPIPDGFSALSLGDWGFIPANGPLYGKQDEGHFLLGFRVEDRHCNPARICHGGMLMTFADMQLPFGIRLQAVADPGFLPTVSMSAEFMAPAPLGAWVEGRTDVLKTTRNLAFAQCLVTADGAPVLRASGIFKMASTKGDAVLSLAKILGKG
ncbi:MAG TPA: PaaI family thioesterase [Rhizomicrobium sp.]|nr:PaaI family thioesterase [Rhizomicrobium sp.]